MHQTEEMKKVHAEDDALREAAHSPNRRKTTYYILIAIIIGLVTNVFMGLLMDGSKIWKTVSSVSIWVIILPFCAYISVSLVDSLRLWLVSRACGHPIGLKDSILNSMVGSFFAHVTPLAMGGQPFQIYHLHRHGMSVRIATNIIFSRFVVNAMLLVLIMLLGIPVIISISHGIAGIAIVFYLGLSVTVLFALFFLLVLVQPRIISKISSLLAHTWFGRLIGRISKNPNWQADFTTYTRELAQEIRFLWSKGLLVMFVDILLNIIGIGLVGFAFWYPLHVLVSADLGYVGVVVAYIAVWQVVFYIPSPGASGGLEGMFTLIFSTMTGHAEMTLVAVILWRFSTYYLSLIPGMILSGMAFRIKAKPTPVLPATDKA